MNKNIFIDIVITLLIIGAGVFILSNSQKSSDQQSSGISAQKAPDFTLTKYDGSGDVNLAKLLADKPTVIQFWATWCEICRAEFPKNNAIASKYKDQINYIAVDWAQSDKKAVESYIKELGLDPNVITFVMDADGKVGATYGVRGTPVHLFIKKGGEISLQQTGGLSAERFEEEIKKII